MRKVALRGLFAHKGRMLSTLLAVALGVAFVAGVLVLTDTMNRSFDDLFATAFEGTDAVVRSREKISGGFEGGETRGTVDASLLDQVKTATGVAGAEGQVQGFARIIDKKGDPVGADFGPPTFGASWSTVDKLNAWKLRDGKAPSSNDDVVIDAGTAKTAKLSVGDEVRVQTKAGVDKFTVAGIAGFGSADSAGGSNYVLFTTEEAQNLVGQPGRFSTIAAVADGGVSQDQLVKNLEQAVGSDVEVISGHKITEETQSDLKQQLSGLTTFFLVFAVVAVVVGSFVIYNSFAIVVAQRTREMALLRAIGASRRQVRRAVLIEAIVVGLIGALIGLLLGLLIGTALAGLMEVEGGLVLTISTVLTALFVGIVVTMVSALVPARRASKVPPVAAMRDVAIDTTARSRRRFVFGVAMGIAGIAVVLLGAAQREVGIVGLGVAATFIGALLAGPGLAQPISTLVGWPLTRFRGIVGSLSRSNAGRNPRRSASTAYALMIGLMIVTFFLVINSSVRASIDKTLDETMKADYIIDSGSFGQVGLPHELTQQIGDLPETKDVAPFRQAPVKVGDKDDFVAATTEQGFEMFGQTLEKGSAELSDGQVVILNDVAKDRKLKVGDSIDVTFLDSGTTQLEVAGIYKGTEASNLGDYLVGIDEFARHVVDTSDQMIIVQLSDGTSMSAGRKALDKVAEPYPGTKVQSLDDFKDSIGGQLDIILNLILGLLGLAIVIAVLGIANTIALSVLERTRELGLLRAVGMTRRQLRSTIRWESVIIAVFGGLLGLSLGVLGGWGIVMGLAGEGFDQVRIPVGTLVILAIVAGLLGVLAAAIPAWRAGRLHVLDSIRSD